MGLGEREEIAITVATGWLIVSDGTMGIPERSRRRYSM
jgi:hypothetical protein